MAAVRNGIHPLDEPLADSGMLRWFLPSLDVAWRHVLTILPASLILCALILTARWWIQWIPWPRGELSGHVMQFCGSVLGMAIAAFAYVLLVRSEGRPHGVGGVAPAGSMALRLLVMVLIWAVASGLVNWVLQSLVGSRALQPLVFWLVNTFGLVNGPLLLGWVFSPVFVFLAVLSTLCYVMCIRSELSIDDILATVFGRVFERWRVLLISGLIFAALLIVLLRVVIELPFGWLRGIGEAGAYLLICLLAVLILTWAMAWWFVQERALLPECGLEDDLDEESSAPPAQPSGPPLRASRVAPVQLSDAQTLELARHELQLKLADNAPDAAVEVFARWLRDRQRSVNDVKSMLDLLDAHWTALAAPLSAVTAELARNNRSFEAVELSRHGLTRDPAFMNDQPDVIPAWAKRLVQLEHPDLAIRLLATYARHHRTHAGYLGGGLLLARLLISHANQPEAARKLLGMLKTSYPQELQIDQLLRQLGPAP